MTSWKKIAAWIALSTSAGLLGTACTAEMKKTVNTPEAEVASVSVGAPRIPNLRLVHRRRATLARQRCHTSCISRFDRCGRGHACRKERNRCMNRCRRF